MHHKQRPHYLCSELVQVVFRGIDGEMRRELANLEEIGTESVVVLMDESLGLGDCVTLLSQGQRFTGRVEDWQRDEAGFWIQILVPEIHRTLGSRFTPAHLLRLMWSAHPNGRAA